MNLYFRNRANHALVLIRSVAHACQINFASLIHDDTDDPQ